MVSKILRADGTTELASIQSVTYHESVNADTDLRPGCVASSYIEVTCFGAQSDAPDVGEALTYYQVVGETETLIGIFYAEPSIPTKNSYSFVAYDAVHKLDADFSSWLSAHQDDFPYTVYQLVSQACTIAGVTLGSSSWSNSTMSVNAFYADGITCRNILQYAAEIGCKFVRCHTNGSVYFEWYTTASNQRIYPSSGTSGSETRYAYKQDGLTYDNYDTSAVARVAVHPVGEDEVAYYYPTNVTSGNTLNITNNALLYGASSTDMLSIAQSIYTTMTAFGTYRPMTVDMFPNECPFKPGDIVPVTDAQGVSFTTAIMEKTVTDSAVTLASTGREVYGDYALDTAKQLVQLASDIVRVNKLKVGWAEIDEAVVGVLTSIGMNPDEVVVSANTVTEYYLSTSSSSATGGSWSTSIPTWSSGKYVWTRDKTTNGYADGTSSTTYSPSQNGVYNSNLTTALSTAASASSAASTAQSTANGANAREQTIYISKASGTSSVAANTTWVTNVTGNQNTWTTKRPVYNSSYPVLFIAQQSQTVSQYNGGSGTTCSCTTPVKDDTTTVIDGGHITTGTIDASVVNVTNIDASNINTGALTVKNSSNEIIFQADASNKTVLIGGLRASGTSLYYEDPITGEGMSLSGTGGLLLNSLSGAKVTTGGEAFLQSISAIPTALPQSSLTNSRFYVKKNGSSTSALVYIGGNVPLVRVQNTNADATASSVTANTAPIEFIDKNSVRVGFLQSGQDASGNVYMWIGSQRKNGSADLVNDLTLWTYANGTRGVSVAVPAEWRTAIGAVNKAGDTMTGTLNIDNNSPGAVAKKENKSSADTVTANDNSVGFRVTDQNSNIVALYTDRYLADGNLVGAWIAGARMVNGSNVFNSLQLLVDSAGNQVVTLSAAAWRKALDMCYAVNDTMSITSSAVLHGFVSSKRKLYLDFIVDKSMENISSVTVTTMTGTLQGVSGAIGGSNNINFISSGYTVSCIKQSLYHIRISVEKTSDFSNATAATPMTYFGTLALKFT